MKGPSPSPVIAHLPGGSTAWSTRHGNCASLANSNRLLDVIARFITGEVARGGFAAEGTTEVFRHSVEPTDHWAARVDRASLRRQVEIGTRIPLRGRRAYPQ